MYEEYDQDEQDSDKGGNSLHNLCFTRKLFDILADERNAAIISWSHDGSTFEVTDPKLLERDVLPKYFRHGRFQSLVRQLNFYSFKKVGKERSSWIYTHPCFRRGRPELLLQLRRKTNGGGNVHYMHHLNLPNVEGLVRGMKAHEGEGEGFGEEEGVVYEAERKRKSDAVSKTPTYAKRRAVSMDSDGGNKAASPGPSPYNTRPHNSSQRFYEDDTDVSDDDSSIAPAPSRSTADNFAAKRGSGSSDDGYAAEKPSLDEKSRVRRPGVVGGRGGLKAEKVRYILSPQSAARSSPSSRNISMLPSVQIDSDGPYLPLCSLQLPSPSPLSPASAHAHAYPFSQRYASQSQEEEGVMRKVEESYCLPPHTLPSLLSLYDSLHHSIPSRAAANPVLSLAGATEDLLLERVFHYLHSHAAYTYQLLLYMQMLSYPLESIRILDYQCMATAASALPISSAYMGRVMAYLPFILASPALRQQLRDLFQFMLRFDFNLVGEVQELMVGSGKGSVEGNVVGTSDSDSEDVQGSWSIASASLVSPCSSPSSCGSASNRKILVGNEGKGGKKCAITGTLNIMTSLSQLVYV